MDRSVHRRLDVLIALVISLFVAVFIGVSVLWYAEG